MSNGFQIDHKSFRAMNVGRPPEQLIREAVQNAMDENPDHIRITVQPAPSGERGMTVTICDDGPGFRDLEQLWTIFASDKRDDPTKRGRLGRGLKELLSVADEAFVTTAGRTVRFNWNGKTMKRTSSRAATEGTDVKVRVKVWKKSDVTRIVEHLRLFIPPEGTAIVVNGVTNARPTP